MKKRILSILLTLCVLLGMIPAMAVSAAGKYVAIATDPNGTRWNEFTEFNSRTFTGTGGGTLILLQDVSFTGTIRGSFKLEGGEYRVSGNYQFSGWLTVLSGSFEQAKITSTNVRLYGGKFDTLTRSVGRNWNVFLPDANEYAYYDSVSGERLSDAVLAAMELTNVEVRRIAGECPHTAIDGSGHCADCQTIFAATTTQNGKTKFHESVPFAATYFSLGTADAPVTLRLLRDLTAAEKMVLGLGIGTFDLNGKTTAGEVQIYVMSTRWTPDDVDVTVTGNGRATGLLYVGDATARIENGTFASLQISPAATVALSGGTYDEIDYWDSNRKLTDFLANDAAKGVWYEYRNWYDRFVDGSTDYLTNVRVVPHTEHQWKNKVCTVCGAVADTTPPTVTFAEEDILRRGNEGGRDFVEVKGDTLHFTATDASGIKSVTDNERTLTPDADGRYSVAITDTNGRRQIRLTVWDNAENKTYLDFMAYRMAETRITAVPDGFEVVEICGEPVTADAPADAVRWRRVGEGYSVKVRVPAGFKADRYLNCCLSAQYEMRFGEPDADHISSTGCVSLISASRNESNPFPLDSLKNIYIRRAADTKAPEATVSVKGNAYSGFTQIFTSAGYGLFYRNSVSVAVAAADDNSGVAKAEYLFTEKTYTVEKDLIGRTDGWQTVALDADGKGSFTLNGEAKGYLYVRVTDKDGNAKIVNVPTGSVIYRDAKIRDGESDTITKDHEQLRSQLVLPIDLGTLEVSDIVCRRSDGTVIPMTRGEQYRVSADGTIVLDPEQLLFDLKPGTYTFTVSFGKAMGETVVVGEGNEAPENVTVTLIVKKAFREILITGNLGKIYDSEPMAQPGYVVSTGGGQVKFEYKVKDEDNSTYTTTPPEKVGAYTVRVIISGDDYYDDARHVLDFKIRRREVTVANIRIRDKFFDGTTGAQFDGEPTANGLIDGDDVTLVCGEPSFADAAVGDKIAVSFTAFALAGADADNYTLIQPSSTTANIKAYVSDGSEYTVSARGWTCEDFVVRAKEGWQLSLTNTPDGEWSDELTVSQEDNDGTLTFYLKRAADGAISEAVSEGYKIDKTDPTGEIRIDERSAWQTFLNEITFGLFFKDAQTVTITAADNSGAEIEIEVLLTDEDLTKEQLADKAFTAYGEAFGIAPDSKLIVYARLTDKAGNVSYLRSDGIVLDGTSPVIRGIEDGRTYCAAPTVTIDETYTDTVTVNGDPVELDENGSFILAAAEGEQTIVAVDRAGNRSEMTVTVNDGHTFGDWTANGDGTHTRTCTVDGCTGSETEKCAGGKATCKDKAVCAVCGDSYGEIDPDEHDGLTHVEAKAATADAEGNGEYWVCSGCGKYYRDAAATEEIDKADTVIKKLETPKTGDDSAPALWAVLALLGSAVLVLTARIRRRRAKV